jgi:Trypsin-like peptidase domain
MKSRKHKLVYLENSQYYKSLLFLLWLIGSFYIVIDRVQATTGSKNGSNPIDSLCLHENRQNRVKGAKQICEASIKYIVKIRGSSYTRIGEFQGSGFIIKKIPDRSQPQQYKYYVLTNKHVIKDMQKELSILTSDRDSHSVNIDKKNPIQSNQFDIGIVYFVSKKEYQVAKIDENFITHLGEEESETDIFVVGYPKCEETNCQEPKFTQGKYGLRKDLLDKNRLVQGYSIPYNNDTEEGMSGSPIITTSGTVIGIHGQGKYDTSHGYVLENKAPLPPNSVKMMKYFSWGIPVDLAKDIIPSNSDEAPKQPGSGKLSPSPGQPLPTSAKIDVLDVTKNIIIFILALVIFFLVFPLKSKFKNNKRKNSNSPVTNPELSESAENHIIAELRKNTKIVELQVKLLEEYITTAKNNNHQFSNTIARIEKALKSLEKK